MKLELKDVAKSLDLPIGTIERWIRQGRIPIKRRGELCVFDKSALEKWAKSHNLSFFLTEKNTDTSNSDSNDSMLYNLTASMRCGGVFKDVEGSDAESIFRTVVNKLKGLSENETEELVERLLQREELISTGVGKGVAIPHPRSPLPNLFKSPIILICFLRNKVNFGAVDDKPVSIMFFLFSPNTECHLHLLSRLSFCLRDNEFADFLNEFPEPDTLFEKVEAIEKQIERADKE